MKRKVFEILVILFCLAIKTTQAQGNYKFTISNGSSGNDGATSCVVDANGNIYSIGYFSNTLSLNVDGVAKSFTSNGQYDIVVKKISKTGKLMWVNTYGSTGNDVPWAICLDNFGTINITGYFNGSVDFDHSSNDKIFTSQAQDIFILKLNSAGNFIWAQAFGGHLGDEGRAIVADKFGNIYVAGHYTGSVDWDPGSNDLSTSTTFQSGFILKISNNMTKYGISLFKGDNASIIYGLAIDEHANLYSTGSFRGTCDFDFSANTNTRVSNGSDDIFIAKLNSNLSYQWAINFGNNGSNSGEKGFAIACDQDSNVYVTGQFLGAVDFDPGSGSFTKTASGSFDGFYAKYNGLNGGFLKCQVISGSNSDYGYAITCDGNSNVLVSGVYTGTNVLVHSLNNIDKTLSSVGADDVFVVSVDKDFNYISHFNIGGNSAELVHNVYTDQFNSYYISGGFNGIVDFNANQSNSDSKSSIGGRDDFLMVRYNCLTKPILNDTIVGNTNLCPFTTVDFTVNSIVNSKVVWTYPNSWNAEIKKNVLKVNQINESGEIVAKYENACGISDSTTQMVVVNTINRVVTRVDNSIEGHQQNATFRWLDCNNNMQFIAGATNYKYTPVADGSYAAEITLNGCKDTSDCFVFISNQTNSENIVNSGNIKIYPNPCYGVVNILFPDYSTSKYDIQLLDITGKLLMRLENFNSNLCSLSLDYEAPVLILKVRVEETNSETVYKIINNK